MSLFDELHKRDYITRKARPQFKNKWNRCSLVTNNEEKNSIRSTVPYLLLYQEPIFMQNMHIVGTSTFPEHPSSTSDFSGVPVTRSLVLCVCFVDRCLTIVLSVRLRYTDSDYPFSIFKLFMNSVCMSLGNIYITDRKW
jgi:hypothetical protein